MAGQLEKRKERGGNPWRKEEGDSVLIIPDDRIEGLTRKLETILEESKGRLYAEHIAQTSRTNLEGMVEKGLLAGTRAGRLKLRLCKQIVQELDAITK